MTLGTKVFVGAMALLTVLLVTEASFPQLTDGIGERLQKFSAKGKQSPSAEAPAKAPAKSPHRLILQVASNEAGIMNLALNNATNVAEHYRTLGEQVQIEIVVYGPGLHMLRSDTSPVKSRISAISQTVPSISFMACNNTQEKMQKEESKEIPLVPEAKIVRSGVVRVMELQEQGWSYVRP